MRQSIYPDWFDVACAECGKVLNVFCFTKKDRVEHLHFCEDKKCLEDYYNKKFCDTKARYTIARLLSMRHNRNQRVEEYLRQESTLVPSEPPHNYEELLAMVKQADEEYKIKLRLHKGVGV